MLAGGVALLAVGVLLLAVSPRSLALTLALAAVIVVYDAWHKHNRAAPLLMGTCRGLVYLGAAVAAGGALSWPVIVAGAIGCGYVMLLTAWSRSGGRHVGTLVAGISLLDAAMIASTGRVGTAALAVGAFMLTRWLQRWVSGT